MSYNVTPSTTQRAHASSKFLECMLKYQQINNIKNQCVANVQYLRDMFFMMGVSVVVKPTICIGTKNDGFMMNAGHLTIYLKKDTLIDPSYEFQSIENKMYFHSLGEFLKYCKTFTIELNGKKMKLFEAPEFKDNMAIFVRFIEIAKDMNNGEMRIASKKYYNELADYVENRMRECTPQGIKNIDKSLTSRSVFDVFVHL